MKSVFRVVAAAALSFACVSAAQGAVMTVNVYGSVTQVGVYSLDVFQVGGASLLGRDIHVRFVFDTDTPGATTLVNYEGISLMGSGAASPVKATATIGGVTVAIPFDGWKPSGRVTYYNSLPIIDEVQYSAGSTDFATDKFAQASFRYWSDSYEILQNHDLTETFDHIIPDPQFYSEGEFEVTEYGSGTAAYLGFRGNRIVVTSGAPVPEPDAWALMIGGLGLAGAALRRQRRRLA